MPGRLSGVRVLDLTGVVSGPFATMFLADQGADVLKIEPIGGDITRRSRATIDRDGEFSALFISSNRGKRSLSIDIKSEIGCEVLSKLVAQADVLVQNFRPGTMERLGLGPDELRKRHPRLIYVSISGVGETGPYVKKRVYDPIIQGLSGFADIQSQPVTNRPQMIRTIVCDKTTAIFTAQAVSSTPTSHARRSCAAARSSITSRWWRATSSRSSISRWSDGCGSRSRPRGFRSTKRPSAAPRPASASTPTRFFANSATAMARSTG